MNLKEIKELIAIMNENDLTELEIEREGMRVKLKKISGDRIEQRLEIVPTKYAASSGPGELEPSKSPAGEAAVKKGIEIKSPMVGTFYEAPSPDSPPYVEAGSEIAPGQVLCIIEAMKLMNEIKSEIKGRIVEKLVENSQPVEYGQALFLVEPT